jgi:hypothetical protein
VTAPQPGAIRRIMALTIGAPTPPARELIARLAAVGKRFAAEDQLAAAA